MSFAFLRILQSYSGFILNIVTLKNEDQFKIVKKFGEKTSCSSLILVYYPKFYKKADLHDNDFYYGMKVSKKFSKSSPLRNRAKRRIRALIQGVAKDDINIYKGGALVVIPKKNFNNHSFSRALTSIKRQIQDFTSDVNMSKQKQIRHHLARPLIDEAVINKLTYNGKLSMVSI